MRGLVVASVIMATLAGCSPTVPPTNSAPAPDPDTGIVLGDRVDVHPSAALLTEIGQSRPLAATAIDAAGNPVSGEAAWTSSAPDVIAIGPDGKVTAKAFGTAQIVATVGGVASAPAIVIASRPAPGVRLVADEQVVALEPIDTGSYRLSLRDPTLATGDLVAATGEQPLAGRVASVDGATATIELVPLGDILPEVTIDQTIDLGRAPIHVPEDIANLYDISRSGTTFTFTPKPNFMDLLPPAPAAASGVQLVAYRGTDANRDTNSAAVTGTYMLPFEECESELTGTGTSWPLALSVPPVFSVDVNPSLNVLWTPEDELVHWLVRAAPKATIDVGLTVNAQLEGKIECKATYFEFRVPVTGVLSAFVSGIIPVGVGFELGGKITLATAGITAKAQATATAALGLDCSSSACQLVNTLGDINVEPEWTFDAPSIGDIRIEPSFEAFGWVEAKLGNVLLALDVAKAKVGAKLEANWAPRVSQIADRTYRSEYGFTVEAEASVGAGLGEVGERFNLGEITIAEFTHSEDLYHSPTATVSLDRESYGAGDSGVATVHFDPPENLKLLGLAYNVESVVLVADTSTSDQLGYEELAVSLASENQVDFQLPFTTTSAIDSGKLYAFVIPRFLSPSDELALELEGAGRLRLGFLRDATATATDPDGTNTGPLRLGTSPPPAPLAVASPSGARWAYVNGSDLWVSDADGGNAHRVGRAANRWTTQHYMGVTWSPDESRIAYALDQPQSLVVVGVDGSGSVSIPAMGTSDFFAPSWSPDGSRIVVEHLGTIYLVTPGSTSLTPITRRPQECPATCVAYLSPGWSPDGSQLAALGSDPRDGKAHVFVMNADGSGITPIARDVGLILRVTPVSWSGSGIAFSITIFQGDTPSHSVWAIDPDGSGLRPLVGFQATIPAPYWFRQP